MGPDFPSLADEIAELRPDMNIKVTAFTVSKKLYRSTSLSQSPREWRKYFELSEVRHKQNVTSPQYDVHVQFLQDILLQYMCSQNLPTDNRIGMKTKEIHFSLFYFLFNYVVDRHNATDLARDKQYYGSGDFLIHG